MLDDVPITEGEKEAEVDWKEEEPPIRTGEESGLEDLDLEEYREYEEPEGAGRVPL